MRERLALDDDPAGDALTDLERHVEAGFPRPDRILTRGEGPGQRVALEHVDPGGVGVEQAKRLVDGLLEDRLGVAQGRDVGGDLAQRSLGVGLAAEFCPRAIKLLDEPGVRHRDGRLSGQRLDDPGVVRAERIRLAGVHGQGPERALTADERHGDDRPDGVLADVLVRRGRMLEPIVVEVVAGEDGPQFPDGPTGDPLAGLGLAAPADRPETGPPSRRRVVGPVESAARLVEDVDPGSIGSKQPGGLVDGPLENFLRVTEGDDPPADLAQRAFRFCAAFDVPTRAPELLDEVRVGHRGGGMIGEGPDQGDLGVAEGVPPPRERAHRAVRPGAADERGHDEGVDVDVVDEAVGLREVDERRVGLVVARHDDSPLGDGPPEHPGPDFDLDGANPIAAAVVRDAGVVGEPENPRRLVEEVGHGAVGPQ